MRQQRPADRDPTESIEMTPRTQPTSVPKPPPRQGRSGKNRSNTVVADQETESSQF